MDIFFSFLFLLIWLVPIVLLILLYVRTNDLGGRIRKLESLIGPAADQKPPAKAQKPIPPPAAVPARPVAAPAQRRENLEALIGGKLMNRIGALALVLGVGFFLKYAFDNNWITETTRVLIGIAAGLACLLGGFRTHSKGFGVFAQGLVGAGIAILYLSLYASFNFYQLIPQWVAFLLMSLVTAGALGQAVYYNSLAVSLLGLIGGFLTPFLLSTGESNEIALFTYTALLALGLLALTVRNERWFLLDPLALVGSYIIYFVWYATEYAREDLWVTMFFIILFWLLFHTVDVVRSRLALPSHQAWRHVVQAANAALAYTALMILLDADHQDILGSVTFAVGILYAATLLVSQQFRIKELATETRNGLIAAVFLLIGTAVEFHTVTITRLWALEGLALLWIGLRSSRTAFSIASLVFLAGSVMLFLFARDSLQFRPAEEFIFLFNDRVLSGLILAGALGAGAFLTAPLNDTFSRKARPWLGVAGLLVLFVVLTAETNDIFRQQIAHLRTQLQGEGLRAEMSVLQNERQLAISAVWLGYSILVMALGILRSARGPRFLAIGLFGLAILKIFIVDLSFLETLYRIFSFLGLGMILLLVSYLYQRYKSVIFGTEVDNDQKGTP